MADQAKGTLHIENWEEAPYQEWDDGSKLVRAHVTAKFSGDLEGEGSYDLLMAYASADRASFAGVQLFEGRLGGREGRFVLQLSGTFHAGTAEVTWSVVPGSGRDGLQGLRGSGGYVAGPGDFPDVTVALEYDID